MRSHSASFSVFGSASILALAAAFSSIGACSSTSTDSPADSGTGDTGPSTCAAPGKATPGPTDTHCQGVPAQTVSAASCTPDASAPADDAGPDDGGADAGTSACEWGPTQFGQAGDDDDCKYHVAWTSSPLCEGTTGVTFTVTVTNKADGKPVTGIPMGIISEVFIPTDPAAACDDKSTHPAPSAPTLVETAAGSGVYAGNIAFDAKGDWTVRFHIHEECADLLEDSPHGHVAFRVTLP